MDRITIEVWHNQKRLVSEEDGYLGENFKGKFELKCFVPKFLSVIAFCVDGKKNISVMKDYSYDPNLALYQLKIPIRKLDRGITTTFYPFNNFRMVKFLERGKFEIWEVAIVSQDGLFFLTTEMTYEAKCYRGESGEVVCPRFEWETKWPQLMKIIKPIFEGMELLPISEYVAPSPQKVFGLSKNQGKVVWWSLSQGMGAIVLDEKGTMARVHWKGIKSLRRLRFLIPGEIVQFEKLNLPLGKRKTGFLLEAKDVFPVKKGDR